MTTKTTMGQLVANLFTKYERRYHDEELAAIATQVTLDDLMRTRRDERGRRPHRRAA